MAEQLQIGLDVLAGLTKLDVLVLYVGDLGGATAAAAMPTAQTAAMPAATIFLRFIFRSFLVNPCPSLPESRHRCSIGDAFFISGLSACL